MRPFTDKFISRYGAKCTVSSNYVKRLWSRLLYMKDIIGYKGSNRLKKKKGENGSYRHTKNTSVCRGLDKRDVSVPKEKNTHSVYFRSLNSTPQAWSYYCLFYKANVNTLQSQSLFCCRVPAVGFHVRKNVYTILINLHNLGKKAEALFCYAGTINRYGCCFDIKKKKNVEEQYEI